MNVSDVLKQRRVDMNISQSVIAQKLDIHYSTMSRLEAGLIRWKFDDVVRVCEILGLEIEIKEKDNV